MRDPSRFDNRKPHVDKVPALEVAHDAVTMGVKGRGSDEDNVAKPHIRLMMDERKPFGTPFRTEGHPAQLFRGEPRKVMNPRHAASGSF